MNKKDFDKQKLKELIKLIKPKDKEKGDRDTALCILNYAVEKNAIDDFIDYVKRKPKSTLDDILAYAVCYGRDDLG